MFDLLKELCSMSSSLSKLMLNEKETMTKKGLLELLIMVNEKIEATSKYKGVKLDNDYLNTVIHDIKETENLITGYKQKTKSYTDILEHVIDVMNEVETLFLGVEFTGKLLPINQAIKQLTK